ncbi:MAG TPA: 2-oxoglutarate dehydrogenase complex dihydrolipoyllysine-residue succinyltransferase [Rubrobacteraceae bacterium]|nr:2-oxoglutarate dehydrogenase complex dihydrolipoyllysine-residue succinyltransferase [Rubrobacteraceae bacterium]
MPAEIYVPELGESVAEATVGRWLKSEGDEIKAGEPLVELETDKINFEVEAEQDGVLQSIAKGEGEDVGVGEVIGTIDEGAISEGTEPEGPVAEQLQAYEPKVAPEARETEAEQEAIREEPDGHREEVGVRASPSVRRLAREYGIELAGVEGSGSGGRITREDVERLIREQYRPAAPGEWQPARSTPDEDGRKESPAVEEALVSGERHEERIRMSRRRQTIAQRLVEAQQTAAMLTTFNEADMSAMLELRRRRKDAFEERYGVRLGFMSFFTKAAIGALKAFPKVNAELQGNELVLKHYYDIGVAVNTDEGLVVPVVRNADRKSFAEIEREISSLAEKAREGTLGLEDLRGGTFTITNGGIFGSLVSTPILNAPQVAILGMHKIQERPVAVNGQVEIRPMMYLALSYDHRIVDGADAVSFLVRIKEFIEDPGSLLLEG